MKKLFKAVRLLFTSIAEDDVMQYSSSIAFYTLFSLPAMILVILFTTNLFVGENTINYKFYGELGQLIGQDSSQQLKESIGSVGLPENKSWFNAIVGIGTLLFSATTLFATLQSSLNQIWHVKAKPKRGWVKIIVNRVISFSMVLMLGFILLVSLLLDAVFGYLGDALENRWPNFSSFYAMIINNVISFGCITLLFGLMFKILPDAKIKWRNIWIGALVTALMFVIGKYAISYYLGSSSLGSTYGAAGALVILLLWVFYIVTIVLIGAEFTKVYTYLNGDKIMPTEHAVHVELKEVELENKALNTELDEQEAKREEEKGETPSGESPSDEKSPD